MWRSRGKRRKWRRKCRSGDWDGREVERWMRSGGRNKRRLWRKKKNKGGRSNVGRSNEKKKEKEN